MIRERDGIHAEGCSLVEQIGNTTKAVQQAELTVNMEVCEFCQAVVLPVAPPILGSEKNVDK